MRKQWVLKILLILFLAGIIIPGYSYGEIIFEDNFENYNWSSTSAYGTSVDEIMPFNLSRDTSKPGWYKYRHAATANQTGEPVFMVSTETSHSGAKSLKYEIENTYDDWNGGGVTVYLGSEDNTTSGYTELYISVWIKFDDTFIVPYLPKGYSMKLFRIYFGTNPAINSLTSEYDQNDCSRLETFINIMGNGYMKYSFTQWPDYRQCPRGAWDYVNRILTSNITDYDQWKRVMLHIRLNTAGNADGLIEGYIGDTLVASFANISLVNTTSEGPIENNKINAITIPDNYVNLAAGMPANSEVSLYIDDIVVSTSYIGPDYIIRENKTGGSPVLNFSDIDSGPKTGNTDGLGSGAIVTIWGNYLGSTQGTSKVYVGDVEAAAIYYWKDADGSLPGGPADLKTYHKMQEIAFAIPAGAADGLNTIKVTVQGVDSNTLPFTVRAGKIEFVKSTGNDSTGTGSWDNPYLTLSSVFEGGNGRVSAGDIVYSVGVCSTETGLCIGKKAQILGTAANPISLIAYPNTSVLFSTQAPNSNYGGVIFNFWGSNVDRASQYINLSKLSITARGNDSDSPNGVYTFKGNRLVGLEITGPTVYGGMGGAFTGGGGGNVGVGAGENASGGKYYGIYMHNYGYQSAIPGKNNFGWVYDIDLGKWTDPPYNGVGDACTNCTTVDRFQHLYYISNRSRDAIDGYEIAWNYLTDNPILHGIHIYDQGSSLGGWNTPILIHHNVVRNQRGDSIDVYYPAAGVGPNIGTAAPVYIHDNLIINDAGNINNGRALLIRGAPLAKIYNNTIYGYRYINDVFSASSDYRNNLMVEVDVPLGYYKYYICNAPTIRGNNLFYGTHSTPMPTWFSSANGDLNEDPLFTNAASNDFSLQANSPAISAGSDATLALAPRDFYGQPRLAGKVSIGAFEYVTTTSTAGDINADGIVNILDLQLCVNVVLGIETDAERVKRAKEVAEPLGEYNVLDLQAVVNEILNSV